MDFFCSHWNKAAESTLNTVEKNLEKQKPMNIHIASNLHAVYTETIAI